MTTTRFIALSLSSIQVHGSIVTPLMWFPDKQSFTKKMMTLTKVKNHFWKWSKIKILNRTGK